MEEAFLRLYPAAHPMATLWAPELAFARKAYHEAEVRLILQKALSERQAEGRVGRMHPPEGSVESLEIDIRQCEDLVPEGEEGDWIPCGVCMWNQVIFSLVSSTAWPITAWPVRCCSSSRPTSTSPTLTLTHRRRGEATHGHGATGADPPAVHARARVGGGG
jgi:hypothetical protein